MNSIAFIFKQPPHGSSSGREGLDALLAAAALSDEIGVFFIGEGVFHLLHSQEPAMIYARDYISTFKLLELYDIENVYVCQHSLKIRGVESTSLGGITATALSTDALQQRLDHYDKIISF